MYKTDRLLLDSHRLEKFYTTKNALQDVMEI